LSKANPAGLYNPEANVLCAPLGVISVMVSAYGGVSDKVAYKQILRLRTVGHQQHGADADRSAEYMAYSPMK